MSRRTIIRAALSVALIIYILIMVPLTNRAEQNDTFRGLEIKIDDPAGINFVTANDINSDLGDLSTIFDTLRRHNLNTYRLEKSLNSLNRVESATCLLLNDGRLLIEVKPFDPVARVFDPSGSVYVNAHGKRVPALPDYHVDVPVVTSDIIADSTTVKALLPLLRKIKTDKAANALVSSLRIDRRGDIIIIPNVLGHVINFGDTTLIDNKFARLSAFYRDVMPVKGWNAYDSVSVKWVGRVTATKRDKSIPVRRSLNELDDIVDEILDDEVMLTESDTPPQP